MNCKGVESLNGADKRSGLRAEWAADMLRFAVQSCAERYATRNSSQSCTFITIPPRVRDHMNKACKTPDDAVVVNWFDQNSGLMTLRLETYQFSFKNATTSKPWCACGAPALDLQPCEHILQAARKAAVDPGTLIWEHETLATWRAQYANLPEFLVPTSFQMQHLTPDEGILECPVKPFGKGRVGPNSRRLKGAQDFLLKRKRIKESELQKQNNTNKKKSKTTEEQVHLNSSPLCSDTEPSSDFE